MDATKDMLRIVVLQAEAIAALAKARPESRVPDELCMTPEEQEEENEDKVLLAKLMAPIEYRHAVRVLDEYLAGVNCDHKAAIGAIGELKKALGTLEGIHGQDTDRPPAGPSGGQGAEVHASPPVAGEPGGYDALLQPD